MKQMPEIPLFRYFEEHPSFAFLAHSCASEYKKQQRHSLLECLYCFCFYVCCLCCQLRLFRSLPTNALRRLLSVSATFDIYKV